MEMQYFQHFHSGKWLWCDDTKMSKFLHFLMNIVHMRVHFINLLQLGRLIGPSLAELCLLGGREGAIH